MKPRTTLNTTKPKPEAVTVELARLNRAVVRETDQGICDRLEARIRELEQGTTH